MPWAGNIRKKTGGRGGNCGGNPEESGPAAQMVPVLGEVALFLTGAGRWCWAAPAQRPPLRRGRVFLSGAREKGPGNATISAPGALL